MRQRRLGLDAEDEAVALNCLRANWDCLRHFWPFIRGLFTAALRRVFGF